MLKQLEDSLATNLDTVKVVKPALARPSKR